MTKRLRIFWLDSLYFRAVCVASGVKLLEEGAGVGAVCGGTGSSAVNCICLVRGRVRCTFDFLGAAAVFPGVQVNGYRAKSGGMLYRTSG